ncbi:phage baseplate assembly protein V, partial [Mariniflexile ostreae]
RGLSVGSVIDIETAVLDGMARFATKKHGKYIITEITHYAKEAHYYTNSFVALPADIGSLPEPEVALPIAHTQMARVLSNEDPQQKGRVQVQMNWQSGEMKTAWIRVLTPDGGSSDQISTNRGFVFIPEKDDQVLLGFRFNDPNRPFVLGSLFNGQTGAGGNINNNIKSIYTRTGSTITFDEGASSILVKDPSGNTWFMDGKGNIQVTAPKNMTMNVGEDLEISVGKNMNINVGKNMITRIDNNNEIAVGSNNTMKIENLHKLTTKNYKQTVTEDKTVAITGDLKENTGTTTHKAEQGDILFKSAGVAKVIGAIDAKVNKG